MNKSSSLYINCPADSDKATIKIHGPVEDAIRLLSDATVNILAAYFQDDAAMQLAWAAAMSAKVVDCIAARNDLADMGDPDDNEEDDEDETVS